MKKFKLGEFERNSAIVFAISMLANVVTYLYQIVMGNLLSPADYGTINTLLSLSIVVGVPSGIISTLVATYTAKYQAVGKPELIGGFMHKMLRASVLLACVVFAAGAALSSIIALSLIHICSAASSGGINCFLRLTTPGSQALPSFGSTWNASRTICSAALPQYIRSVLWVFMSVNM